MTDPNDHPNQPSAPVVAFGSATLPTQEAPTTEPDLTGAPIELNATGEVAGLHAELPKVDLSNVVPGGMPVQTTVGGTEDHPTITAVDEMSELK